MNHAYIQSVKYRDNTVFDKKAHISFYYFFVTSWKTFERIMLLDNKIIYVRVVRSF